MVPGKDGLERTSWFLCCYLSIPPPFSCYRADVPTKQVPQLFLKSKEIKRSDSPILLQTSPPVALHRPLREVFRGHVHLQLAGSLLGRQARICHAPTIFSTPSVSFTQRVGWKMHAGRMLCLQNTLWPAQPAPVTQISVVEVCSLEAASSLQSSSNVEVLGPALITSDGIWGICSSSRNAFLSTHLGYLHKVLLSSSPLLFKQPELPTKGMVS